MVALSIISPLLLLGSVVLAHPGHNVAEEAAERAEFFKRDPSTVRSCAGKLKARGLENANIARRQALANDLRAKRGLKAKPIIQRRDFSTYNFTHLSDSTEINYGSDETVLFADNSSCVLQNEVTEGPYYVNGELIRSNIAEDQEGIPLVLDIQIIDTSTCEPVPAIYMDLWHCNSTGVYSGIVANGNGDTSDASNINNTALRGIQQTNSNGIVQFETLFPGHYTGESYQTNISLLHYLIANMTSGRATHIHILTHNPNDTTVRVNNTLLSSNTSASVHASHVGQLFFDQDLIAQADTIYPYSDNTQEVTLNSDDDILASEADTTDPFVEYILLGDKLEDGILAWISVGIDPTQSKEVSNAATIYADGGVANSASGGAPGGDGPPDGGNGTAPSGSPPTGTGVGTVLPSSTVSA